MALIDLPPATSPELPPGSGDVASRLDAIERQLVAVNRKVDAVLVVAGELAKLAEPLADLIRRANSGALGRLLGR